MAEHLSAEQVREFEQRLRERHRELREEIHQVLMESDDTDFIALAGRVHDAGEASVADMIVDLNIRQLDHQVQELYAVESALARMRNGTYGICIECGTNIQIERLRAIPTAVRCIDCQTRQDTEHAGGLGDGTPTL